MPEAVGARPKSIRERPGSDTAHQDGMTWPLVRFMQICQIVSEPSKG
jgi:hypothetical protein